LIDKKKLEDCQYIEYNMKAITNEWYFYKSLFN
jgi:hypothetical protein